MFVGASWQRLAATFLICAAVLAVDDPYLDLPVGIPKPDPVIVEVPAVEPLSTEQARDFPFPVLWGEEISSTKLIVVVDLSQSMWDHPKRIVAARAEFARFVGGMWPEIKFDVVTFTSNTAKVLWPKTNEPDEGLRPATDENKAAAIAFVNAPTSGGNTPSYWGVKAALDFRRNDRVVLITDGMPTGDTPCMSYWLDPRKHGLGYVAGIPGPAPEYMSSRPPLPSGWNLLGIVIENEYMIRRENLVVRPGAGARPAVIDVFGIDVEGAAGDSGPVLLQKANAYWFCSEVARCSAGSFTKINIP